MTQSDSRKVQRRLIGGGWATGAILALCLGLAGCASTDGARQGPPVEKIILLSAPAAVDLDQLPGADGIAIRIYASNRQTAKTIPVTAGTLEILMHDGVAIAGDLKSLKPLKTWSLTAAELRPYARSTTFGVCYSLLLSWGDARPTKPSITVLALYRSPQGPGFYSGPSTITVGHSGAGI